MNYIDIFFLVLFVLMIISAYQRGFLKSLISFVRFAVVMPISFYVSDKYCLPIYTNYVKDTAFQKITEGIQNSADIDVYVSSIKDSVSDLPFNLGEIVDLSFLDSASTSSFANCILNNIVEPIAIIIIKFLLFVLTLVAFYVITWIIVKAIDGIIKSKRFPFKKADKFLGAVLGVAKAIMAVIAISAIFAFILEINAGNTESQFISQLNSSLILEFVNKYNPILSII